MSEGVYTCPMKLLDAYADEKRSNEEKHALVQSSFSKKASREIKISKELFNLFIQLDPSFPLSH